MPLQFASPSSSESLRLQAEVKRRWSRSSAAQLPPNVELDRLAVGSPHAVYDLYLDQIAAGGGLETARHNGIRHFVESAGQVVAATETKLEGANTKHAGIMVDQGFFVEPAALALKRLAAHKDVLSGSYEVRYLRFVALRLVAIWLHSTNGGDDLIYPLSSKSRPHKERILGMAEFLNEIQPGAGKALAAYHEFKLRGPNSGGK